MKTVISFGETLWDLLPEGPALGGAPFNLAFRVTALGERGVAVTRLGRDPLGQKAFDRMAELGMDRRFVQWDPDRPTGTVPVRLDARGIPDFTILRDVAYDRIVPTAELLEAAAGADGVCFGSLCQRSEPSRGTLGEILDRATGALKFFDVNLRKDCYTKEVVESSLERADLLKLNDAEAFEFARLFGLGDHGAEDLARQIRRRWDLDCCVLTLGERGAFAASRTGEAQVPGCPVDVVDTIGSGDAFAAAFLTGWLRGRALEDCVRAGNALGALVAGTAGATAPVPVRELERLSGRAL